MSAWIFARASAVIFALMISVLGGSAHAAAYALRDEAVIPSAVQPTPPPEPFGLSTSMLPESPLRTKWSNVERAIAAEAAVVADCDRDLAHCTSQPALRFLAIVKAAAARDGVARLGEVNRAFNLAIRPVSDRAQYGIDDHWTSPLATLEAGAGDCEDYAIAKLVALRAAGVAADDLRLVIIRETASGEDHAVVAARVDGHWRMLDNRSFIMLEDSNFGKYRPLFAIDAEGAKRFEQPMFADASRDTQARPAEIETQNPARADASAVGLTAQTVAFDEFCQTLAM